MIFNYNPLEQFEIRDFIVLDAPLFFNLHLSLTNISTYLITSLFLIILVNLLINKFSLLIFKNWLLIKECIYDTVHGITIDQINKKDGQMYFPFIITLFLFILINNLIGMIPYSFSPTSHFILTFSISFTVVIGATILGFSKHNIKFFSLFVPAGCPLGLVPILVTIEFISYLARNISLGLRLAANVLSGHMLLSILSGFTYKIMTSGLLYLILGILPLLFIIAFSSLELAIAFIQAQVFIVLSCGYTKDALELH
jgi:F-type H+-transporting ATPase subunit a